MGQSQQGSVTSPSYSGTSPIMVYYAPKDLDRLRGAGSISPAEYRIERMKSPILGMKDHSKRYFKERPK